MKLRIPLNSGDMQPKDVKVTIRGRGELLLVEQAISPHRSGVYLVYVDVQTVGNQNHPFQNQLKNERIEQTQPIINRKRRKEKTQYFILFFAVGDYRCVRNSWASSGKSGT